MKKVSGINTARTQPLQMGYSGANVDVGAGTMGAIVEPVGHPGIRYLLSCCHVLAPLGFSSKIICQPSRNDDFRPTQIAALTKFSGIRFGIDVNFLDAALGQLLPGVQSN
ncbi:MAG: hypothetical protein KC643_29585, partial [Nitrospira sp.]|nr:hypothetical protein [Nitrospira sp.]